MTLKAPGFKSIKAKVTRLFKDRKTKSFAPSKIKTPKGKTLKDFNFGKLTKIVKLPKAKKVALLKKAVKKVKNVGF